MAEPKQVEKTDPIPIASDAHATGSMGWVMPVWLISFLVVAVFGVVSYLFGWWFSRG